VFVSESLYIKPRRQDGAANWISHILLLYHAWRLAEEWDSTFSAMTLM